MTKVQQAKVQIQKHPGGRPPREMKSAIQFLESQLQTPKPSRLLRKQANQDGISRSTLDRAAEKMGVQRGDIWSMPQLEKTEGQRMPTAEEVEEMKAAVTEARQEVFAGLAEFLNRHPELKGVAGDSHAKN